MIVTIPYRTQLQAGKSEDIGMVLADLSAIVSAINGNLEGDNFHASAAIAVSKINISGMPNLGNWLFRDGSWSELPTETGITKHMKTTTKDVVNTTNLTDLFNGEITIAADEASEDDCIFIWAAGDYLNNTGNTRSLRMVVQFAGSTLWNSGLSDSVIGASGSRRAWNFIGVIQGKGVGSGKIGASGVFGLSSTAPATTGLGKLTADTLNFGALPWAQNDQTLNLSSGGLLELMAQHGASSGSLSVRLLEAAVFTLVSN